VQDKRLLNRARISARQIRPARVSDPSRSALRLFFYGSAWERPPLLPRVSFDGCVRVFERDNPVGALAMRPAWMAASQGIGGDMAFSTISTISDKPQRFARVAGGLVLSIGLAVLLGWAFDIGVLKTVGSGWVAMQPNAALCFALL